jgi:hypothetical protein
VELEELELEEVELEELELEELELEELSSGIALAYPTKALDSPILPCRYISPLPDIDVFKNEETITLPSKEIAA